MKCIKILGWIFVSLLIGCTPKPTENKSVNSSVKREKKREKPQLNPDFYNVGFVIMEGTFNTELTAPFDIFQHTKYRKAIKGMNVFTLAKTTQPIRTFEGLLVQPDFNYVTDSLPKIDILVVPSAEHHLDSDLEDVELINFVKKVGAKATWVTSHCDGAFVLAEAGLLTGKAATTFPSDIEKMKNRYTNIDVKQDVLFVRDGKYITSVGGAKSFEAALYLCQLLYGEAIAKDLAKGLVIDWNLKQLQFIETK